MGKDLYDADAAVRDLFALASDVAGRDMAALVFDGSDEDLKQTDNTQIAVTLVNLAASRVLASRGVHASAVAGFSLGEYAALVDAGVLSAEDAFRLVVARGSIMERASRSWDRDGEPSGMAAVILAVVSRSSTTNSLSRMKATPSLRIPQKIPAPEPTVP